MSTHFEKTQWGSEYAVPSGALLPEFHKLLLTTESLTQKLRSEENPTFEVFVREENWELPWHNECDFLGILAEDSVWVRMVELRIDDVPWIFARTIFPRTTLANSTPNFQTLGRNSLGDILFNDPMLTRSTFELAQLTPMHKEYMLAIRHVQHPPEILWGRRSIFYFEKNPLLVMEVFLPAMIKFFLSNEGKE